MRLWLSRGLVECSMTADLAGTTWSHPKRILLLTYKRSDHLATTFDNCVVGIPDHRASITKAKSVRSGDWVLIRLSESGAFAASRPARVAGMPVEQRLGAPYPNLLWPEEVEVGKILFPLRIPVTFEGGPRTRPGCVNFESLSALRLRGKDGYRLDSPQQWGKKFTTNVLDSPNDVAAFVELLLRCAA
jgi:hypothetical protein